MVVPLKPPSIIGAREADVKPDQSLGFTRFDVGESLERHYQRSGRYLHLTHWVTNLSAERLSSALPSLKTDSQFKVEFKIEKFPHAIAEYPALSIFFNESFNIKLSSRNAAIGGLQLTIALSTNCEECAKNNSKTFLQEITNRIRLICGVSAALTLSLETFYDIEKREFLSPEAKYDLLSEQIGLGDDPSALLNFLKTKNDKIVLLIKSDVNMLLSAAMESNDPTQKFLFLWIALEVQLGADGKKRADFCLVELQSPKINDEMLRLRNIRVDMFHHGVLKVTAREITSLIWLLRLACVSASAVRDNLSNTYENWLAS